MRRWSAFDGKKADAKGAFELLRRTVIWSDDLFDHDRDPMIEWARKNLGTTFPAKRTSKEITADAAIRSEFPELTALRL